MARLLWASVIYQIGDNGDQRIDAEYLAYISIKMGSKKIIEI